MRRLSVPVRFGLFSFAAALAVACSASPGRDGLPSGADDALPNGASGAGEGLALDAVPAAVRAVAQRHVETARGTDFAPAWTAGAKLTGPARPLYRPDVEGVAYYELGVSEGGFVVVSTGAHDHPIAHVRDGGERITDVLAREADAKGKTIARMYKLDTLVYAAEDAAENVVAEVGAHVLAEVKALVPAGMPLASFRDVKRGFGEIFKPSLDETRANAERAWKDVAAPPALDGVDARMTTLSSDDWQTGAPNPPGGATVTWIWNVGALRDKLAYDQIPNAASDDIENGCLSGCGPTAWAQYTAYMDYAAHRGDTLYRDRLHTDKLLPAGLNTTFAFDADAKKMVWQLYETLNTRCVSDDQGMTLPFRMSEYEDWAKRRGVTVKVDDVGGAVGGIINRPAANKHARKWIEGQHRPVIAGTGNVKHYAIGIGYAYTGTSENRTTEYIYVNQGWRGAGNGWIPLDLYYSGVVREDN